jgi:hypothetical protein
MWSRDRKSNCARAFTPKAPLLKPPEMMGFRNTDDKDAKACLGLRRKLIMPSNGKNAY